jgi:hypothetical protein
MSSKAYHTQPSNHFKQIIKTIVEKQSNGTSLEQVFATSFIQESLDPWALKIN